MLAIRAPEVYKENLCERSTTMANDILKESAGLRYNGIAIGYAVSAYLIGFAGLFSSAGSVNAVAVLLLAHAMTIAAYLIHECGHQLVFRRSRHNARLGRAMSWI